MLLRRAKEEDFEEFKVLYTADIQWLYKSDEVNPTPQQIKEAESILYHLGIEDEKIKEIEDEYKQYSKEQYHNDLKNNYVYVLQEENTLIGYLIVWKSNPARISQWGLNEVNQFIVSYVTDELKKALPKTKFEVATTNKAARRYLSQAEFEEKGFFFMVRN